MIFDGHSDIWADVTIRRLNGEKNILIDHHMERLRKGQIEGGIFVIWVDPPFSGSPLQRNRQTMKAIGQTVLESDAYTIARNYEEITAAKEAGQFYIVVGVEGLSGIGEDVDLIDGFYDFGARHASLTWNEENALASGVRGNPDRGLTEAGKRAVRRIQELGMILDVSHLNDRSFWDVARMTEKPIVASHSNARTLSGVPRNLTDDQLLEIRDSKGLVGLNAFNHFVNTETEKQTLDSLVKHCVYIADKIGVEHLGFGFDFFEFLESESTKSYSSQAHPWIQGLEDCTKAPNLVEALRKEGFSQEELEGIKYKNWHRIIKTIVG